MKKKITTELLDYLRCSYPAVAVETHEEGRLMTYLDGLRRMDSYFEKVKVVSIDATGRLMDFKSGDLITADCDYQSAFKFAAEKENVFLVVLDLQHLLDNAGIYRSLKNNLEAFKAAGSPAILVAPTWKLPAELVHDVPVVDFPLPTREDLGAALDRVCKDAGLPKVTAQMRVDCLDSMAGLTVQESENAAALCLAKTSGKWEPELIASEKIRLIKSSGLLELAPPPQVEPGGLGELYSYVDDEVIPVKDDPELQNRGVILVGVQGGGKSLASKVIGSRLKRPVLKMSFSGLKGGIVGQSEGNMKRALKLADAVSPCVLWVDEIDKGTGGHASSDRSDGGVTSGMLGIWLEWLQEHETPVFVVATCNDFSKLPPELTRAGRFDERFFVDLPNELERPDIAAIHLERFMKAPGMNLVDEVLALSDAWTGAEIEQLIKSAARRTQRNITVESLRAAAGTIRPISKVKEAEVRALREWAGNALRPANTKVVAATGRKFRQSRSTV